MKLEKEGGLSLNQTEPLVTRARVVEVRSEVEKTDHVDRGTHNRVKKSILTFEYSMKEDKCYTALETFYPGEVIPVLGQYVVGVVVQTQWGGTHFVTTHLLAYGE